MHSSQLPILRLTGTDPQSWGRQHGEAMRQQVREMADIRAKLLSAALGGKGWSAGQIEKLCDDQLAALAERWPTVLAELQGISEASNVSLRELVVANAYTDLRDFSAADASPDDTGCSAIAAHGPHVNFIAQTWDMHASAEPYTLLLEFPDAARPMRVLTVAGCVGLSGVNAAGVSVMINTLQSSETNRHGLLWPGLVRLMLQQPTAQAAVDFLAANLPSAGRNFIIADRTQAFDIEVTGRRFEQIGVASDAEPAYLLHTNHYRGSLERTELKDRLGPTTHQRLAALERFTAELPVDRLNGDELRRAFFETGALCSCINLRKPVDANASATCGGLGVDHLAGKGFAFRGQYRADSLVEWNLR